MAAIICCGKLVVVCGDQICLYDKWSTKKFILKLQSPTVSSRSPSNEEEDEPEVSENGAKSTTGTNRFLVCKFSTSGNLFAVCDEQKQLHAYQTVPDWKLISRRLLTKRASCLAFTENDDAIVVGDKSGDVYKYSMTEPEKDGELILGHLSFILDMVLVEEDRYVVTCDRDEKIRISHFPNAYNIHTFCLGHSEYVSQLIYVGDLQVLLSGSGDGNIMIWSLDGKSKFSCKTESPAIERNTNPEPNQQLPPVKHMVYDPTYRILVVTFYQRHYLNIFQLVVEKMSEYHLNLLLVMQATSEPWDVCFDLEHHYLWYLQGEKGQTAVVHKIYPLESGTIQVQRLSEEEESEIKPVIRSINQDWDFFQDALTVQSTYEDLKKVKVDNMKDYLERKQQRIEEKCVESPKKSSPEPKEKKVKFLENKTELSSSPGQQ